MNWDTITYNIEQFFSKPVPIIGVTIGFVLIFTLVVLSKTSIGKKALNKLTGLFNTLKEAFIEYKAAVDNKVKELKEFYEKGKAEIEAKELILEELCLKIAENSHNEKIKAAALECKEKLTLCKTDYEVLIEERVKAKAEEVEKQIREEYETKYKAYFEEKKAEIEQLVIKAEEVSQNVENKANMLIEEKTNEIEKVVDEVNDVKETIEEVINDERKEETDSSRTEEEIK